MKKFFKWFGLVLLGLVACAAVFCAVTAVCASGHDISFYEQLRQWFGSASAFAKLFTK